MFAFIGVLLLSQTPDTGIRLPSGERIQPDLYERRVVAPQVNPNVVEKALKLAFADVDAPIVLDLPDRYIERQGMSRSAIPKLPNDAKALGALADLCGRHLDRVGGAYVVHRQSLNANGTIGSPREEQVFEWLADLLNTAPAKFEDLMTGGVDFSELGPEGQSLICGEWYGNPNSLAGVVAGIPVNVSISAFPRLLHNGGDVGNSALTGVRSEYHPPMRNLPNRNSAPEPFVAQVDGELDFGDGAVLSVVELASKASDKFKLGFAADSRFAQCPIFVKGKFTPARIAESLRLIGTAGPGLVVHLPMGRQQLMNLKRTVLQGCVKALSKLGDSRLTYLQQTLYNPRFLDPEALSKYGYTPEQIAGSTSVSINLSLTMSSNIFEVIDPTTGAHRLLPTSGTEVILGN